MVVSIRTRLELLTMLDELTDELEGAAERFDQGTISEASTLATHVRSLVHHSAESQALIHQLGVQHRLTWVDTAGVTNPASSSAAACLTLMNVRSGRSGEYVPKLGLYPPAPIRTRAGGQIERGSRIPFDHWWTNPVVKDADGLQFCRKQFVLALAAPGETHDREVAAAYRALAASSSLGWVVTGENGSASRTLASNPVMASVRQIGYEVLQSIRQQRDVLDEEMVA